MKKPNEIWVVESQSEAAPYGYPPKPDGEWCVAGWQANRTRKNGLLEIQAFRVSGRPKGWPYRVAKYRRVEKKS